MSNERKAAKEIVVVIGPGSIGLAIARRVGTGRTLLLAAHDEKASQAAAEQLRGEGYEVAVQTTDISELVERLGDEDIEQRALATSELIRLGPSVYAQLHAAQNEQ